MMIERFDLDNDLGQLDWESCEALIELTDLQRGRARLRSRWMLRTLLDVLPDFHLDQVAAHYNSIERHTPPPVAATVRISKEQ